MGLYDRRKTCEWCSAAITAKKARLYCSTACSRAAYRHIRNMDVSRDRKASRMEKLVKIKALVDALEAGGTQIEEDQLLHAGLLHLWSVSRSADDPNVFELISAADRNASVPWALPPPHNGDKRWLVNTLRRIWLPKAREYLSRQNAG